MGLFGWCENLQCLLWNVWRQHTQKGKKVLGTHSCEVCRKTLSLQVKQETHIVFKSDWINPFSSRCRNFSWPAGDSSLLSHVKVRQPPHKTQDKTLYSGKVKSQVFLLTLRPFPWLHMFSKKEKLLQASAFQPSLLFLWFKADLNWLHQIHLRVKRHIALDLFL